MKIYTKTGDLGQTSLFSGKRVPKHHIRVESYGNVDELNAFLGLLRDQITDATLKEFLLNIQHQLFVIGSNLAFEPDESNKNKRLATQIPQLEAVEIEKLETEIDRMQATLPKMTHFILPGGHPTVSTCHVTRSVCRRAERSVTLLFENEAGEPDLLIYLNRLSDYLFVLCRFLSQLLNVPEIKWIPKK